MSLESQRVLSAEKIADIEVGQERAHQFCLLEIRPNKAGPSGTHRRSFRLTEERFHKRSTELADPGVISVSEGTESAGGSEPSKVS